MFPSVAERAEASYAIVFQAEHPGLAGALASGPLLDVFGELPPDVIQAIGEHDFRWKVSDEDQTNFLSEREPRPFQNPKIRALKMQSKLTRSAIRP